MLRVPHTGIHYENVEQQVTQGPITCVFPVNTKHFYSICTMLDQRRRRWADVVQMLYKCFVFAGLRHMLHMHRKILRKLGVEQHVTWNSTGCVFRNMLLNTECFIVYGNTQNMLSNTLRKRLVSNMLRCVWPALWHFLSRETWSSYQAYIDSVLFWCWVNNMSHCLLYYKSIRSIKLGIE